MDDLTNRLQRRVEANKEFVARWTREFTENPTMIADSRRVFEAIAETMVYQECLHVMQTNSEEIFKNWVRGRAIEHARSVQQSSSPTSNLYGDYLRATWAKVSDANPFSI